jgi:hypothetical protein
VGLGVVVTVQVVPFHASAKVTVAPALLTSPPTAMQASAELHDTPLRVVDVGLGVVMTAQAVPFHISARVTSSPALLVRLPTAMQASAELHDTPLS